MVIALHMGEIMKRRFTHFFGTSPENVFSAPGRTELGGNHTDHQHGKVLAAAINLDTKAATRPNNDKIIRIKSEGYDYFEINLRYLEPVAAEKGTTGAIVRGIAGRITQMGFDVNGFDAYITSTVMPGSGLSSSAAFEVLIGTIINYYSGCGLSAVEIARIGQYAENVYFGKPCGLMDQTASSVGSIVAIDFESTENPIVEKIEYDFSASGYALCIIDSGADHVDLTEEYIAIPGELGNLCRFYGKEYLRQLPENEFYARITAARKAVGDRAVLRAIHVYEENKRVDKQLYALKGGDFEMFLELVRESGNSSWKLLQNITPGGNISRQEVAFALSISEKLLNGKGACRVHGGGFAGTIQAFVPNDMLPQFKADIESYLGAGRCHVLKIRPQGGIREE